VNNDYVRHLETEVEQTEELLEAAYGQIDRMRAVLEIALDHCDYEHVRVQLRAALNPSK
jgi:hypothetical protein